MDTDTENMILEELVNDGIEEVILCPQAFKIAEKLSITPMEVGRYCNENKIKIRGCQLGCFK